MEEYGAEVVISPGEGLVYLSMGEGFILVFQTSCDVPAVVSATATRNTKKVYLLSQRDI
jgi:hypothetical protein